MKIKNKNIILRSIKCYFIILNWMNVNIADKNKEIPAIILVKNNNLSDTKNKYKAKNKIRI